MRYELFYLVGVSKELELEKIKQDVDEIVTSHEGVFEEKITEEKRKMAYKIKKDTHGIYIAKRFSLEDTTHIGEIINKLNLNPGVLRFIVSDASELPELKTKEERMEQEEKRNATEAIQREKQAEIEKEKIQQKESALSSANGEKPTEKKTITTEEEVEAEEKTKKETAQDLDKKLEEILNI
ncbi:MAG: 30S ribosomal protein S6 [Candidatus Moraniibacteriota bacterium]